MWTMCVWTMCVWTICEVCVCVCHQCSYCVPYCVSVTSAPIVSPTVCLSPVLLSCPGTYCVSVTSAPIVSAYCVSVSHQCSYCVPAPTVCLSVTSAPIVSPVLLLCAGGGTDGGRSGECGRCASTHRGGQQVQDLWHNLCQSELITLSCSVSDHPTEEVRYQHIVLHALNATVYRCIV